MLFASVAMLHSKHFNYPQVHYISHFTDAHYAYTAAQTSVIVLQIMSGGFL